MECLTLILHSPTLDGPMRPLDLDRDEIVIGRNAACDIHLPDASISQRHATIRADGGDYTIVDDGSSNGTLVNDDPLEPHKPRRLEDADLIRIGCVWLEVWTRLIDAGDQSITRRVPTVNARRGKSHSSSPSVRVASGPDAGRVFDLEREGATYVVGRTGETCDFPIPDSAVSKRHAQISREDGQVIVRDLGSKNGSRLGDAALAPGLGVPWPLGVELRLGSTVLRLCPAPPTPGT